MRVLSQAKADKFQSNKAGKNELKKPKKFDMITFEYLSPSEVYSRVNN